jgi:PAS domain S-box-containing protein
MLSGGLLGDDHTAKPVDAEPSDAGADRQSSAAASARLSGNDHLRLLFDNMLEGYAYCRMIFDSDGHPCDFIYVDVNRAFHELTGLRDVVGKRVTEVIPDIRESNPELFEVYGRVARWGEPERFETTLDQLEMVLDISVFRPEPDHFVAVFENITERKCAEQQVEQLVRFLEYQVEQRTNDLAEALRLVHQTPQDCPKSDDPKTPR